MKFFTSTFFILALGCGSLLGVEGGETVDFSTEIRPILNSNCIGCHGGVMKSSGVSFLFREEALAEGKSGKPTVVPGDPMASEMYLRIISDDPNLVMPSPKHGPPLKEKEQELIKKWIEQGAKWGDHWSFEEPERAELPEVKDPEWPKTRVDHFLLAKMAEQGLEPNGPAAAEAVLRRLNFDLIGLPPSPEEIEAFVVAYATDADAAVATKADELLASEHFGEKWASHWLDLARYADSEGLGVDTRREMFPYRDWVVRAFNADMPFDEFTKMQIAGDQMPDATLDHHIATAFHRMTQSNGEGGTNDEEFRVIANMDRLATTWEAWQGITFGCVQCHSHPYEPIRHEEYYEFMAFFNNTADRDLEDHHPRIKVPYDHSKYDRAMELQRIMDEAQEERVKDSIAIRDSIDWMPVANAAIEGHRSKVVGKMVDGYLEFRTEGTVSKNTNVVYDVPKPTGLGKVTAVRVDVIPLDEEAALHTPEMGAVISHFLVHRIDAKGNAHLVKVRTILGDDPKPAFGDSLSLNDKHAGGWGPYSRMFRRRSMVAMLAEPVALAEGEKLRVTMKQNRFDLAAFPIVAKRGRIALTDSNAFYDWGASAANVERSKRWSEASQELRKIDGMHLPVLADLASGLERATKFFDRGNWLEKRGDDLKPDVPKTMYPFAKQGDEATRIDLANWLVSDTNPLTARVAVNRVWEQIFGFGIVLTLEDFGSSGALPTHPALLDDLAVRFREDMGWSHKTLIRELVTSAAYRQDAKSTPEVTEQDAYNLYLSRGPRRRLTAEMARDNALAASGLITRKLFGRQVYPPIPEGGYMPPRARGDWKTPKKGDPDRYRRAIYTYIRRSSPFPQFAAFDAPTREVCSKRRLTSNTPIAALTTMNDPVFVESIMAMAQRVHAAEPEDIDAQIALAFELATSRSPKPSEADTLQKLYQNLYQRYADQPELAKQLGVSQDIAALNGVCSVLLNLDEAIVK